MKMNRILVAALVILALGYGPAALAYEYVQRHFLKRDIEKYIGKKIKVVDELVRIWGAKDAPGHVRFDTVMFRCAIAEDNTAGREYLNSLIRPRNPDQKPEPLLCDIYGSFQRVTYWGDVEGQGKNSDAKEKGVTPEEIVLVVDRVERPRKHFYDDYKVWSKQR